MKSHLDMEAGLRVLSCIARHTLDDPITGAKVEEATGISSRTVTDIVTLASGFNIPIGSCPRGYFKWRSRQEREVYLQQEKSRIANLGRKLSAIKRAAMSNELTLWEQEEVAA